jgi:hypothetical protein
MGLGNMIENAFKLLREEQESIAAAGENGTDEETDDNLFDYDTDVVDLTDKDFADFKDLEDAASEIDDDFLKSLMEEGV